MEDNKAARENIEEILSVTERLYETLKNTPGKTLTREQVLAHPGVSEENYYRITTALASIKKVIKITGQKGGIEVRTGKGIRPEILPCNRRQLERYFLGKFPPPPPEGEGPVNIPDGEKKAERIRRQAIEILENCPEGIRPSEWKRRIKAALPEESMNTIGGTIWDLHVKVPELVSKPAWGLFLHTKYGEPKPPGGAEPPGKEPKVKERHFYQAFAEWLVKTLHECTDAKPVGGKVLKDKWGTPDVIGVRKQKPGVNYIALPTEIVSAEIKLDTNNLITAFGQACAYRLVSHKSYIVVPENSLADDIARLDTLSRIFGIGLITFNPQNPSDPKFSIRARAATHNPDMHYVDNCMKRLDEEDIHLLG